jgi:hypothetical protein
MTRDRVSNLRLSIAYLHLLHQTVIEASRCHGKVYASAAHEAKLGIIDYHIHVVALF